MTTTPSKIGITMGDPSGIGPEIIVKALQEMSPEHRSATAVIGNRDILKRADKLVGAGLTYVDALEAATAALHSMGLSAVEQVVRDQRFARFALAPAFAD